LVFGDLCVFFVVFLWGFAPHTNLGCGKPPNTKKANQPPRFNHQPNFFLKKFWFVPTSKSNLGGEPTPKKKKDKLPKPKNIPPNTGAKGVVFQPHPPPPPPNKKNRGGGKRRKKKEQNNRVKTGEKGWKEMGVLFCVNGAQKFGPVVGQEKKKKKGGGAKKRRAGQSSGETGTMLRDPQQTTQSCGWWKKCNSNHGVDPGGQGAPTPNARFPLKIVLENEQGFGQRGFVVTSPLFPCQRKTGRGGGATKHKKQAASPFKKNTTNQYNRPQTPTTKNQNSKMVPPPQPDPYPLITKCDPPTVPQRRLGGASTTPPRPPPSPHRKKKIVWGAQKRWGGGGPFLGGRGGKKKKKKKKTKKKKTTPS